MPCLSVGSEELGRVGAPDEMDEKLEMGENGMDTSLPGVQMWRKNSSPLNLWPPRSQWNTTVHVASWPLYVQPRGNPQCEAC